MRVPSQVEAIERAAGASTRANRRAAMAGDWVTAAQSVMDIGCGAMALCGYLRPGTRYIGVDSAPRDANTIVVDFDRMPLPAVEADAAVVLGVIEYRESMHDFLVQLRRFPTAVISYNHASLRDRLRGVWRTPKRATRISARCFRRHLQAAGLTIVARRQVRRGEAIYKVRAAQ